MKIEIDSRVQSGKYTCKCGAEALIDEESFTAGLPEGVDMENPPDQVEVVIAGFKGLIEREDAKLPSVDEDGVLDDVEIVRVHGVCDNCGEAVDMVFTELSG